MTLDALITVLSGVQINYAQRNTAELEAALVGYKSEAVRAGDERAAKYIWCLQQVLSAQVAYIRGFAHCKLREFYAGWCAFADAEGSSARLRRHFDSDSQQFTIPFIHTQVSEFQELFPYKLFASVGLLVEERICSICGASHRLRHGCQHIKGEIYQGEMCAHVIKKSQLLEVSVVDDPVDRRCVSFVCKNGQKGDQHDYAILDYVMSGLSRPFDSWRTQNTYRLEPKTKHERIRRNDKCPCGSGKKFKNCCISGEYIRFPHIQVEFDVTPFNTLPDLVMADECPIKGLLERSTSVDSIWAQLAPVPISPIKLGDETKPDGKSKLFGTAAFYG